VPTKFPGSNDLVIRTTLDARWQAAVEARLAALLDGAGREARVGQGAVVVLDAASGAVRAMAGGRDFRRSPFNRATDARRQPGSTFKSFVFLAAIERGATAGDQVSDLPISVGRWSPSNGPWRARGSVTLEEAFAQSVNTAAVRVMGLGGGPRAVAEVAHRLGVEGRFGRDGSIALGTGEVTLLDMTAATATLANGGRLVTPYGMARIEGATLAMPAMPQVVNPAAAAQMRQLMQAGDAAWQRACGGGAGRGDRRQDRYHAGLPRRLVRRLRAARGRHGGDRRLARQRRQPADGRGPRRHPAGALVPRGDRDGARPLTSPGGCLMCPPQHLSGTRTATMDTIIDPSQPDMPPRAPDPIKDGDQRSFMADVIEASREVPVLVDFWATWCGPCKTLTPALEKVVRAAQGRVRWSRSTSTRTAPSSSSWCRWACRCSRCPPWSPSRRARSPTCSRARFPRARSGSSSRASLKMAGGQLPGADMLGEAKALAEAGDHAGALEIFAASPRGAENAEALAGLARCLVALTRRSRRCRCSTAPGEGEGACEIASRARFHRAGAAGPAAQGQLGQYEQRLAADPDDHAARIELAVALNAMDQRAEAADALLEAIKRDRSWGDEAARKQLLKFFDSWGMTDPATLKARRGLSVLLFR
jgi:thioredoxin-like negative regulator of GroEL